MQPEHLFVLALATWRIANLLVNEAGPFDLFGRLRAGLGIDYDPLKEEFYNRSGGEVAEMLLCIYCTSIWVAAAVLIAYLLAPTPTFWFCAGLSLSTVTCVIDRWVEGG